MAYKKKEYKVSPHMVEMAAHLSDSDPKMKKIMKGVKKNHKSMQTLANRLLRGKRK